MKDVYEKNPQMGDPASLAPQINQTTQNMERLRGELSKYEVRCGSPSGGGLMQWRAGGFWGLSENQY